MKTKTIAIFLSMMFATLTVAPDVVVLMDLGCDYSVVLDSGEDEERKKGEEKDRKNGEEKVKERTQELERAMEELMVMNQELLVAKEEAWTEMGHCKSESAKGS